MSGAEKKEEVSVSLFSHVGKEIDRSLAEIVSALLKPAATELGHLIGDSIGIYRDRISQKRSANVQSGFEEVRKKLDAADVDMKDITPPKEEELHLLITGLSLSDDQTVRKLWAGLFANALDPKSDATAERPFLSVLATLSPLDAKVIDFLAFVAKTDAELRARALQFKPKDYRSITPEEKAEVERVQKANMTLQSEALKAIESKAKEYTLDKLDGQDWASNLFRQGVLEGVGVRRSSPGIPSLRSLEERDGLIKAFENVNRRLEVVARQTRPPAALFASSPLQIGAQFTEFGTRLARACGLL
jgi:hypothetical protein